MELGADIMILEYKNTDGKVIGHIIDTHIIHNMSTDKSDRYYKLDLFGLGEYVISEHDHIDNDRLKAIAEYKRCLLVADIEKLQRKIEEIDKVIEGL